MTDATFEKVEHSDNRLYGPPGLLLCGFGVPAQPKFLNVRNMAGLRGVPVIWAGDADRVLPLAELLERSDGSGADTASTLPRAIIVSGITENQLHSLMTLCRKAGMQPALWAALTPTSESWPLDQLLNELQAERRALAKRSKK